MLVERPLIDRLRAATGPDWRNCHEAADELERSAASLLKLREFAKSVLSVSTFDDSLSAEALAAMIQRLKEKATEALK